MISKVLSRCLALLLCLGLVLQLGIGALATEGLEPDDAAGEVDDNGTSAAISALADDGDVDVWSSTKSAATEFGDGDGYTVPYEIRTVEQLLYFEEIAGDPVYNEAKYVLTGDIDMTGCDWTPVGDVNPFEGAFDGGNHTIRGLNVSGGIDYAGLFSRIEGAQNQPAVVMDLTLIVDEVVGDYGAGAVAGLAYWTDFSGITVQGVSDTSKIEGLNGEDAGGIVGYASDCQFNACTIDWLTIVGENNLGGLAGSYYTYEMDLDIYECDVNVAFDVSNGACSVGGLIGHTEVQGRSLSVNKTRISGFSLDADGEVINYAGGAFGEVSSEKLVINNLHVEGIISIKAETVDNAGGVIGLIYSYGSASPVTAVTIEQVTVGGLEVDAEGDCWYTGGLIGQARINPNLSIKAVSVGDVYIGVGEKINYVGGMFGWLETADTVTMNTISVASFTAQAEGTFGILAA